LCRLVRKSKENIVGNLYDAKLYNGDELTYLNIPVIRYPDGDKFEFEGKPVSKYKIDEIIRERKRISELDKMLDNEEIKYCYISKGSYYRPNSCGYTDMRHRAGVYNKEEAVSSTKSCSGITLFPIDIVEHNQMINNEINDLKSRILD